MLKTGERKGPPSAGDDSISSAASATTSGGQDVSLDTTAATHLNRELVTASLGGDAEAVRVLLSQGAQVNACDDCGFTSLYWAANGGHVEVVKLLIAYGADTRALSPGGGLEQTTLSSACYHGHVDVVRAILAGRKGQCLPEDLDTFAIACCDAVKRADHEMLDVLLAEGADVRMGSENRSLLLRFAAREGKTACVETLLRHWVDLWLPDEVGATALMLAAKTGQLDAVKMLLAYGADVNAKDNEGRRAVAYASRNGHKDVRALVSHQPASTSNSPNGDVDQVPVKRASSKDGAAGGTLDHLTSKDGLAARVMLLRAAHAGDEARVDELLRSPSELDVNASFKGLIPLVEAVKGGHAGVVRKLLVEYCANPNIISTHGNGGYTCLMLAAGGGNEEVVRLLVEHGASVHVKDSTGYSAVMAAIVNKDVVAVRILPLLKAHGADLSATDRTGATLLMMAACEGKIEVMRYLLTNGADPSARDRKGRDAIAWAKMGSQGREVVAVLTEAVKAQMERLAAQFEGQEEGAGQMPKDKNRNKKNRKKDGKGEGAATVCEGDAQAGGGLGGIDVDVDAVAAGVDGMGDGGEEQQVEQATALMAVASPQEGGVEPVPEEAKAQDSATAVAVSADADGVQNETLLPPVELTEEDMDDAPGLFECPISHTVMRDPVAACDGYSYERAHIETWIRKAAEENVALRSPMTNEAMEAGLNRNLVLKFMADEYMERKLTEKKARLAAVAGKE